MGRNSYKSGRVFSNSGNDTYKRRNDMQFYLGKSGKKDTYFYDFTRKSHQLKSVILFLVTITEIYVLCVNDSESKRSS